MYTYYNLCLFQKLNINLESTKFVTVIYNVQCIFNVIQLLYFIKATVGALRERQVEKQIRCV